LRYLLISFKIILILFLYFQEIRQAAELLGFQDLVQFVSNIQAKEEFLNSDLKLRFKKVTKLRVFNLSLRM